LVRRIHFIVVLITALIGFASLPTAAQSGRTFYIDYASGSNANNGTSSSTPWKSHPYMQMNGTCTGTGGNWGGYAHQAGDHFIFKGGVTWPAACFMMTLQAGGSSSSVMDYYGVDTTWFSGSAFTRPIFDLAQTVPTGSNGHFNVINGNGNGFVTIDNLEIKNQNIANLTPDGGTPAISFVGASVYTSQVTNCYIHDFMTTSKLTSSSTNGCPAPGWTPDYAAGGVQFVLLMSNTTIDDTAGFGFDSVGTKITGGGLGGACKNCWEVSDSKFVKTMAACFTTDSCHDSEFTGITQTILDANDPNGYAPLGTCRPHTQIIEDDSGTLTSIIYNNWIHDNNAPGVVIDVRYSSSIYNNVISNNNTGNVAILNKPGGDSSSFVGYFVNNTVDCGGISPCVKTDTGHAVLGTLNLENNIWVGTSTTYFGSGAGIGTLNSTNNYPMSYTEAATYGFTSARKYAPSSSDPHVSGQGANLGAIATGALVPLGYDTAGAPWYGTSYHERLTSWDIGAYLGAQSGSTTSKPTAPTNLTATVQ
jgi:hypothetical protein